MKTLSTKFYSNKRKQFKDFWSRAKDFPGEPFRFPYGFLCGQIFTKEEELLDEADYERMVDAPGASESFRVLNDTGLANDLDGENYRDYEQVIRDDLKDLKNFYEQHLNQSQILQFLFLRYDIANMKLLAKRAFTDTPLDKSLFYQCGLYQPEDLAEYFRADLKKSKDYNEHLLKLAQKLKSKKESLKPHRVDIIADHHHYKSLQRIARRIGNGFLKEYLQFRIDTLNIFNTVRAFKMELDQEDLVNQILPGGRIDEQKTIELIQSEPTLEDLECELVNKWNEAWPTEKLEQMQDPQVWEDMLYKKQLHFIEESERQGCGLELVLGYFLEKQKTYRRIRRIMKAKIDGVAPAKIKEEVV